MPSPPPGAHPARPPSPLSTALATVGGNAFLVLGTAVLGTLAVLVGWTPPRGHLVFAIARLWSRGLLACGGVRVEAEYAEEPERAGRRVYMANHQSLYDIPALIATLPGQTRFLAKRSLFRIPVFGWAIKIGGFITIDRRDRSRAGASFTQAVRRLREGVSVLVFPEGTRSPDGRLLAFQRGGFLLALKSGLPIVPVGIRGTLAVRPRQSLRIRPGRVRLIYGEPIDPARFGLRRKQELEAEVRRRIGELAGLAGSGADPERRPAEGI